MDCWLRRSPSSRTFEDISNVRDRQFTPLCCGLELLRTANIGAPSQGNSQNFEAAAEVVVVGDERTDAGLGFVGNARDGRNAERGGDRRGGVNERAGNFKAVKPNLEQFDCIFDDKAREERG